MRLSSATRAKGASPATDTDSRESSLQATLVVLLERMGATGIVVTERGHWGRRRYAPKRGQPDIVCCWHGRYVALECKASHRDVCLCDSCTAQRWTLALVRASGGIGERVRSVSQMLAALAMSAADGSLPQRREPEPRSAPPELPPEPFRQPARVPVYDSPIYRMRVLNATAQANVDAAKAKRERKAARRAGRTSGSARVR